MITVTEIGVAILVLTTAVSIEAKKHRGPAASSVSDDNCLYENTCGPFVCRARCVASCLDTGVGSTVDECAEKFCQDFNENTPCAANDTACWKTCGFEASLDDKLPPEPVTELNLDPYKDGYSRSADNPYTFRVMWQASPGATLYIVNASKVSSKQDQPIHRGQALMTTDAAYTFPRDICSVYKVQVIAVNAFGVSRPRPIVVDSWKPELHFDENFNVRSIGREGDMVKVSIGYSPPEVWRDGDVQFGMSLVRAYKCMGQLNESVFMSTQPDEDGNYAPLVFINETGAQITLSFPVQIMQAKCSYSYRVSSLRTRCNTTAILNTKGTGGAGVDFKINCVSVKDSQCDSPDSSSSARSSESHEETKPIEPENARVIPLEKVKSDRKSGESSVESEESGQRLPRTTVRPAPIFESNSILDSVESRSKENGGSDIGRKWGNVPPVPLEPGVVMVEPSNLNAPVCQLADFDAEIDSKGTVRNTVNLIVSWMEQKSPWVTVSQPKYFLIRYGQVKRALVVDIQPQMIKDVVLRTPSPSDSSQSVHRAYRLSGLVPSSMYGFQICAIYGSTPDQYSLWDTAPIYEVDLSAPDDKSPLDGPPIDDTAGPVRSVISGMDEMGIPKDIGSSNNSSDFDVLDVFADPLNTSLEAVKQIVNGPSDSDTNSSATAPQNGTDIDIVDIFFDPFNSSFDAVKQIVDEPSQAGVANANASDLSNVGSEENGVIEVDIPDHPIRPEPAMSVDTKQVVVTTADSSWAGARVFWFLGILCMMLMAIGAVLFGMKRARKNRMLWQKQHESQEAP